MAVVETRDLTKLFKQGGLGAVNNVNLETREGEFLVFLGPSGSGKTTLLRMIAGLEAPTSGDLPIGGHLVTDLTPHVRRVAHEVLAERRWLSSGDPGRSDEPTAKRPSP